MHVFVDESDRGDCHLLAATVVPATRLDPTRKLLRSLLAPGQRSIHFKKENPSRQRAILTKLVTGAQDTRSWIYLGRGDREAVRAECLRQLVVDAIKTKAQWIVMDWRDPALKHADNVTITHTLTSLGVVRDDLCYRHVPRQEEPALWLPDTVAWCYGAGQEWRKRASSLIEDVIDVGTVRR